MKERYDSICYPKKNICGFWYLEINNIIERKGAYLCMIACQRNNCIQEGEVQFSMF